MRVVLFYTCVYTVYPYEFIYRAFLTSSNLYMHALCHQILPGLHVFDKIRLAKSEVVVQQQEAPKNVNPDIKTRY